jgi:CO dehydrogenase/acetyl-CoA synthase beta subunit
VNIAEIIQNLRDFISVQAKNENYVKVYQRQNNLNAFFKKFNIQVELEGSKEIILQDETKLELGGVNKKSFSLIYPFAQVKLIDDGSITLIGPEINEIVEEKIDFGLLVLIGFEKITEKDFDNLRQFNFISNGIEGFMIRTIPRRFWCRISEVALNKNFSFELFGNAIMYLYKERFGDLIKCMEIIFLNSNSELIDEFIRLTSDIHKEINKKWLDKIEEWKKRIDCDYDWECDECPYIETCDQVKEVLEERKKM